jgi:hypothetical protein
MNIVDAICSHSREGKICGKPIRWLPLSPRICGECWASLLVEEDLTTTNQGNSAGPAKEQLTTVSS